MAVGARPDLWVEVARTGRSLLPARQRVRNARAGSWIAFRMETAYGDPRAAPPGTDLVAFLAWSRDERGAVTRMRRHAVRAR